MKVFYDWMRLDDFIDAHVEQMVNDLLELLRIPSVSRDIPKMTEALALVLDRGIEMGFDARSLLDHRVGLVEMGEGDEVIGVLAHVDVVDVEGEWTIPPFSGRVMDGWVWGRGAVDDKGAIIAALYAMQAVKSLKLPFFKKVQLIIGTQEEVDWTDLEDYTNQYKVPDYGFTPDGEFPATNREKGYCDVRLGFKRTEEEKKDLVIVSLEAGNTVNTIPSRAQAFVRGEWDFWNDFLTDYLKAHPDEKLTLEEKNAGLVVTAYGVSAHSSVPEKGVNAIVVLCNFLSQVPLSKGGAANLIAFVKNYFAGDIYGKAVGLYSESEYLNGEYVHRNVISPTLLETKENCFNVTFNLRNSYGTTREDIEKAFAEFSFQYDYTPEILSYYDPIYVSKDMPFIKVLRESYQEISGDPDNEPVLSLGTTYAKAMPNIVAWGPVFPGEEDFCHAVDERISIESLVKATKIYARALAELVFSQENYKAMD
ncbi:MAG: Sapep family Mn(2+)-dependent dipeptidase [Dehalobacterium sp.]